MSVFSWENLVFGRGHDAHTLLEGLVWRALHAAKAPYLHDAELVEAAYVEGRMDGLTLQVDYIDGKGVRMTTFLNLASSLVECPSDWSADVMGPVL